MQKWHLYVTVVVLLWNDQPKKNLLVVCDELVELQDPYDAEYSGGKVWDYYEDSYYADWIPSLAASVYDGSHYGLDDTESSFLHRLCGLPPFLDCAHGQAPDQSSVSECENVGGTITFTVAIAISGALMILGNSLVPLVLFFQKQYRNRHNYIKGSLAFVDMLVGAYLLCCTLPNTIWMRGETRQSVLEYVINSENSAVSVSLGSLLMVTIQVSFLHLLLLSSERFVAIKWPFWHYRLRTVTVWIPIIAIWTFCIIEASLLALLLKNHFSYQFNALLLAYCPAIKHSHEGPDTHGTVYAVVTVLLPYTITVILTVWTSVAAWLQLRASKHLTQESRLSTVTQISNTQSSRSAERSSLSKIESSVPPLSKARKLQKHPPNSQVALLKTTSLLLLAFSLSMTPMTVVYLLYVYGHFGANDCHAYALPYFVAFYIKLANSLCNVIIYSMRDQKFRQALAKTLAWARKKVVTLCQ